MDDQGRSDFYVVFTMSLCALWFLTIVNKFAISNHTALISGVRALRSYSKLNCEYDLHSLPNKKLVAQRIMVKNYIKFRPPWSAIFYVIVYHNRLLDHQASSTTESQPTFVCSNVSKCQVKCLGQCMRVFKKKGMDKQNFNFDLFGALIQPEYFNFSNIQ